MGLTTVILGSDNAFGTALCTCFLDNGGTVFGGCAYEGPTPILQSLVLRYPGQFWRVPIGLTSMPSITAAAVTVAEAVSSVDVLIVNDCLPDAQSLADGLDFEEIKQSYSVNALGPIRFIESLLPLCADGMKRLCFVTSADASIAANESVSGFGYSMAKSALHMAVAIMFNNLRPDGFTFRVYIPDSFPEGVCASERSSLGAGGRSARGESVADEAAARIAYEYFVGDRDDEDRLAITDYRAKEWPF